MTESQRWPVITLYGGACIAFEYTNWKGRKGKRRIIVDAMIYGEQPHHEGVQWFIRAFDLDKQSIRTFAVKDIEMGTLKHIDAGDPAFTVPNIPMRRSNIPLQD